MIEAIAASLIAMVIYALCGAVWRKFREESHVARARGAEGIKSRASSSDRTERRRESMAVGILTILFYTSGVLTGLWWLPGVIGFIAGVVCRPPSGMGRLGQSALIAICVSALSWLNVAILDDIAGPESSSWNLDTVSLVFVVGIFALGLGFPLLLPDAAAKSDDDRESGDMSVPIATLLVGSFGSWLLLGVMFVGTFVWLIVSWVISL